MKVPKLRVRHLITLVAASAALMAVLQYRQGVYDPTVARLRKVRYADAAGKAAAIRALIAAEASGPTVVETLFDAFRDSDPTVRALAARAMAEAVYRSTIGKKGHDAYAEPVKAVLAEALSDRDPTVRLRAADGLSLLEVKSEESFAILLQAARTPAAVPKTIGGADDRFSTLVDLANGYRDKPETLRAILAAMTEHDARVRNQGIMALNIYLRGSPPITEPIVEALLARLDDENDSIRCKAGQVLSGLGRRVAARAVPLLIRNLSVRRSASRVPIANTIRNFGLDAAEAGPALRALADDNREPNDVRQAAQEALAAIDKACRVFNEETLPELIAELRSEEPSMRAAAAAELAQHGSRAKAAVPALTKLLDDPREKVRRAASAALDAAGAPQAISSFPATR
jgi:HEAT repeat protein